MIVLVPAYEPDERLVDLVRDLLAADPALHVLVVDDGSGPAFGAVFGAAADLGAVVVRHAVNRGKGRALKTGFHHAAAIWPGEDVVCADSDGQHAPAARARGGRPGGRVATAMVLGSRRFTGPVPSRSKLGNGLTRRLFFLTTGIDLTDTQTGLRAYPAEMLGWLCEVEGERFEYELELLLRARDAGHAIVEVPISTIYLDDNASSHFRPVRDSARVYAPLLRFAASSALAAAHRLRAALRAARPHRQPGRLGRGRPGHQCRGELRHQPAVRLPARWAHLGTALRRTRRCGPRGELGADAHPRRRARHRPAARQARHRGAVALRLVCRAAALRLHPPGGRRRCRGGSGCRGDGIRRPAGIPSDVTLAMSAELVVGATTSALAARSGGGKDVGLRREVGDADRAGEPVGPVVAVAAGVLVQVLLVVVLGVVERPGLGRPARISVVIVAVAGAGRAPSWKALAWRRTAAACSSVVQ